MKNINFNNLIKITTLSVILAFISACNHSSREKENLSQINIEDNSTIKQYNVIDNKQKSGNKPIISAVSTITTDSTNNIYLVDPKTSEIHSFSHSLKYRWSAGGKGDGPGLFNNISTMYAGSQFLYVYDYGSATMSQYSLAGQLLKEWPISSYGHRIKAAHRLPGGAFVGTSWDEENETLINIYDRKSKHRISNFGKLSEILHTQHSALEKQLARNYPGSALPLSNSTILYAPAAYSGQLLVYNKNSENKWFKADTVQGHIRIAKPVIFHLSTNPSSNTSMLSGFNPKGGYFHTEFKSMSFGLYKLKNGRIAHLSTQLNKKNHWNLLIEYFDSKTLRIENYIVAKDLLPSQRFQAAPLWMDKNGRIYMNSNTDKPLRILKIKTQ